MERRQLAELHYIAPLANLASIAARGVLSHERAAKVEHVSVAMEDVQDERSRVRVPGGRRLHQYANFYFNARNAMMYKRKDRYQELGVLSISTRAVDLEDVAVTDCNAASGLAVFGSVDEVLPILDYEEIFASSWDHPNYFDKRRHKARMCAEVLVPDVLPTDHIRGVWVACDKAKRSGESLRLGLNFKLNEYLFFRGPKR